MKNVALLLTGLLVVMSTACSFKQDPLHNQSDDVKNGIPAEKINDPQPDPEQVFNFSDASTKEFFEGKAQTIVIEARANVNMAGYEIRFLNADQFENMQVKSTVGSNTASKGVVPAQLTITWAPAVVPGASSRTVTFELDVISKKAKNDPSAVLRRQQMFSFDVKKDTGVTPVILKVDFPSDVREGEMHLGKVFVEDKVAEDVDGKRPILKTVGETSGVPQINTFMSWGVAKSLGNGQWVFDVRLDLRNELTSNQFTTNVKFAASNRYSNSSPERSVTFNVRSNLSDPQITWVNKEDLVFKVGQKNSYFFMIEDQKKEGRITWSVDSSTDLAKWEGSASLDCKYITSTSTGSSNSEAFCELQWDIPAGATVTAKNFKLNVKNESKISGDNLSVTKSFERAIKVAP